MQPEQPGAVQEVVEEVTKSRRGRRIGALVVLGSAATVLVAAVRRQRKR